MTGLMLDLALQIGVLDSYGSKEWNSHLKGSARKGKVCHQWTEPGKPVPAMHKLLSFWKI